MLTTSCSATSFESPDLVTPGRVAPDSAAPALHVAHVVLSLDVGGLERIVLELLRHGTARGHSRSVICLDSPGSLAEQARDFGATVRCVFKPAGIKPRVVGQLADLLRELRPDVVHTHQLGALLYGGPAARRAGVPLTVHTEHGKFYADSRKKRWLGRFACRYARRVFAVSSEIADELVRYRVVPASKVASVVNGIDTRRFALADGSAVRAGLGVHPNDLVLGTVGRLAEIKRQDVLLHGFARLRDSVPGARLLLVGDGPERGPLEELARDLGIQDRVTFAGAQDRPEDYIAAMDVVALSSRSEGTPLAVLEAWAAGKPVVATPVGGIPELIRDGETGLLFPVGDAAALANRLADLAADPAARARLGEAGRRRVVSEFDVEVMADGYERHYRALLPRARRIEPCAS